MRALSTTLIVLAAIVNFVPVVGVVSTARLEALYGVAISDANLAILMRHRAVLFAIVGGVLAASAVRPVLRPLGVAVGLVSMLSFVLVALAVGDYNSPLARVLVVDLVASAGLAGAAVLDRISAKRSREPSCDP